MSALRNLGQVFGKGKGPWERRLLVWLVICAVGAVVVITGAYYLDQFTESSAFCGALCHANGPQYVTHQISTHADVECGTCHVGPGLWPKVTAKIYGTAELFKQVTNTYERPIEPPVKRMRPADVTCEQCHWAGKSYEDELQVISDFATDEGNSETETYLVVKVDNAHWHVDHPVWYAATDENRQDIVWVKAIGDDGQPVEYRADGSSLTEEELAGLPQRQMDCMDCHNRPAHPFQSPEERLNEAMAAAKVDVELPYFKREAMRLLEASYPTQEAGVQAMEGLAQFYQTEYPDVYAAREADIASAVEMLRMVYSETTFPEMNLTWDVYPDNIGHTDSAGCFRCHDGALVSQGEQVIPYECSLCHTVPVESQAGQKLDPTQLANWVEQTAKPDSHSAPSFIRDHPILAQESCAECHGTIQYGTDNSRFCANEICHAQKLPGVKLEPEPAHPFPLVGQHAQVACNECHEGVREPVSSIENCASCHQPPAGLHFGTECAQCHTPEGWEESAASWVTNAPHNPHGIEAVDCLLCHNQSGPAPAPASHEEFSAELCSRCHTSTFVAQVPAVPHAVTEGGGRIDCLTCHGQGTLQPTSVLHRGVPSDACLQCHTSVPMAGVPVIPHAVEVGTHCLACHAENRFVPVPSSHAGWTNEACLLCHQAGSSDED